MNFIDYEEGKIKNLDDLWAERARKDLEAENLRTASSVNLKERKILDELELGLMDIALMNEVCQADALVLNDARKHDGGDVREGNIALLAQEKRQRFRDAWKAPQREKAREIYLSPALRYHRPNNPEGIGE